MKSFFASCILFTSLCCFAQTSPLLPGTISANTATAFLYNQPITGILATPASGGNCASSAYVYTWEQSIEDGPWTQVGTGGNPPTFPNLIGNTRIRRSVLCGGELLYTNILSIVPVYTSMDFENKNYVREISVAKRGVLNWYAADQLPVGDKFQTTTYLDGLGRTIQTVGKGVSSTTGYPGNDLVKYEEYDAAGRALKDFLLYPSGTSLGKFKMDAKNEQRTTIQSLYGEISMVPTYTLSETDNSPINRTVRVIPPGLLWSMGAVSTDINFNTAADQVHIWTLAYTAGALPTTTTAAIYGDGTLLKSTTTQDGKQVITYTDLNGNLILKKVQLNMTPTGPYDGWICTYNVYDDMGHLCYQFQPEAVRYLDGQRNWNFDAATNAADKTVLDNWCFQYRYDARGRNTWKKAPGAEALQMIYDERGRLVFTQDGNQAKSSNEWTATLYDELDRPLITTLYRPGKTASQLQSDVDVALSTAVSVTNSVEAQANLVLDYRDPGITQYKARNSIEFIPEFQSGSGDEFTAEIDPAATTPTTMIETFVYKSPISSASLNDPSICTILKYQFYDTYSYPDARPFDAKFENATAYSTSDPNVQTIAASNRVTGFATGSKVRVMGTNLFLNTTTHYDERGAQIQTLKDNIKSGKDVLTVQYHFDGRVLSTHSKHTTASTGYNNFSVLTKNNYDQLGRMKSIEKKWGAENFKSIVSYDYDELGRLKTKHLDPGYTGIPGKTELEAQAYNYNIVGNLTGINKDYALKAGAYDKWKNFFGFYLGYDNLDLVFDKSNIRGQVTGQLWTTQGDDVQRKYDYSYDNGGRLTRADYKERKLTSDAWSNAKIDFSVSGTGDNNAIKYDLNGNLLSMIHKGFSLATNVPVEIDKLEYAYFTNSNQLKKVTDLNTTIGQYNGQAGDFKDGANGTARDYVYDQNGNLIVDYNKNAFAVAASALDDVTPAPLNATPAIKYNFLDKPEEITITGKGVIKFVYNAEGNKLQKIFTPMGSGATPVTTTYIDGYVYKGDELQYIGFEEGRIRVIQETNQTNTLDGITILGQLALPNGKKGVYDYYLRDYQQNVRMILTEETHVGYNTCTMEIARKASEQSLFGQIDPANPANTDNTNNEVYATRYHVADIPGQGNGQGWNDATIGAEVSRLGNLAAKKVGPNVLLKVMTGDEITATTKYFYKSTVTDLAGDNLTTAVVSSLINAITGSTAVQNFTKEQGNTVSTNLNAPGNPIRNVTAPDALSSPAGSPKAYLTILFFDERMQYVPEGSTFQRVLTANSSSVSLALPQIKAPRNGYCYVYLSNESNEHVYFDGFQVQHTRGRIIEEDHYYAYGLKIAAISSRKMGDAAEGHLQNNYQYQGDYSEMDEEIGWQDFDLRNYDPQIGRWVQQDPYEQFPSPYVGMGNNPVNNVDEDGGWSFGSTGALVGAAVGFAAPYVIEKITGKHIENKGAWGVLGALVGAGLGYGIAESLHPGSETTVPGEPRNGSKNFWQNFRAFYVGLAGVGAQVGNRMNKNLKGGNSYAVSPDMWSWTEDIKLSVHIELETVLPQWRIWNKPDAEGNKINATQYSTAGILWRSALSPIPLVPFREIPVLMNPFLFSVYPALPKFFPLFVTTPTFYIPTPFLAWPTYQILRKYVILKPKIRISFRRNP